MKLFDPSKPGINKDIIAATRQLARQPLHLMNYNGQNSYNLIFRKDFFPFTSYDWLDARVMGNSAIPLTFDERRSSKYNTDILQIDGNYRQRIVNTFSSGTNTNYDAEIYMYDPSPYNVGYWLGVNYNIIREK
jgi:hypothetical protein